MDYMSNCQLTLVLIVQAVFLLQRGQIDKQTDATECPTPRRRLYRTISCANSRCG